MRNLFLFAGLAAAFAVAAPAQAADLATLSCVSAGVPGTTHDELVEIGAALTRDEEATPISDAQRAVVRTAALECQRKHGWTDAATAASVEVTLIQLVIDGLEPGAVELGVPGAKLSQALALMTPDQRDRFTQSDPDAIRDYIGKLTEVGIAINSQVAGHVIGAYSFALIKRDESRATFAAS